METKLRIGSGWEIAYWATTIVSVVGIAGTGLLDLTGAPGMAQHVTELGYPARSVAWAAAALAIRPRPVYLAHLARQSEVHVPPRQRPISRINTWTLRWLGLANKIERPEAKAADRRSASMPVSATTPYALTCKK